MLVLFRACPSSRAWRPFGGSAVPMVTPPAASHADRFTIQIEEEFSVGERSQENWSHGQYWSRSMSSGYPRPTGSYIWRALAYRPRVNGWLRSRSEYPT